jgi:hypothetical protein
MKQCPTCTRIFADDTLRYCLDDGGVLTSAYDPEETHFKTPAGPTRLPPIVVPHYQAPSQVTRAGVNPVVVYVLIAALALVVGGGVVAILKPGAANQTASLPSTATPKQESAIPVNAEPETKRPSKGVNSNLPTVASTPPDVPRPSVTPQQSNATGDLSYKSCWELKVMRNEIYARYGYKFKSKDMREYFLRQDWYTPLYDDVSGRLSDWERDRIVPLIKQYERQKSCRPSEG